MDSRTRFVNCLLFQDIDRIPLVEWPIREATMNAWLQQGYPAGTATQIFFDLDAYTVNIPIDLGMRPRFDERILEQNSRYKIWQDSLGAIRKDFLHDASPGFVTRTWLEFPVKTRQDFNKMKQRYLAASTDRYPENWLERAAILNQSAAATHLSIPYLFWTARDWVGFENLCLMFYDNPRLVQDMFEFITDFCIETLKDKIDAFQIDLVEFKEDMAYKHAPMISPDMFRKFMAPHYVRLITFLKSHGVKIVYVDCDGYPGGLIPHFIDAGVDAMSPVEIAAGNDLLELRQQYPGFGMLGGIDKRELAKDRKAIYNEVISKVPSLLNKGGYIPHVDHAIPHDVPLANYLYYRRVLTQVDYGDSVETP